MINQNDIQFELIKAVLPHVNFEEFELEKFEDVENDGVYNEAGNHMYQRMYVVTIVEKKGGPPDDSGQRKRHGYKTTFVIDWPIRNRAVKIVIKKRRRRNPETKQIHTSGAKGVLLEPGARKPSDILHFLK